MRKRKLDMDAIVVESFEVNHPDLQRGTVYGHRPTYDATCSCDAGCGSGYQYSCNDTWCPGSACVVYCDDTAYCPNVTDGTCANTCSPCDPSGNNVNTCVAPCTSFETPCV